MVRRYLKFIALTLILLPEPLTTPVGILLLLVVLAIPGRKRLSKFKNLEELVKKSLVNSKGGKVATWTPLQKSMVYHELKGQSEETQAADHPQFSNSTWFDNRRLSERVLHHTLNNSVPQYEAPPVRLTTPGPGAVDRDMSRVLPAHRLKIENPPPSSSEKKPVAADGWVRHFYTPDEVVLHTLKTPDKN
jgi:hypothetical protein